MHVAAPAFVARLSPVSIGVEHQKPAVIIRAFGTLIWRSSQEHHAIWYCFRLNFALDGQSPRYQLHLVLRRRIGACKMSANMTLALLMACSVLSIFLAGRIAERRGRSFKIWAWIAAIIGPLALPLVFLFPDLRRNNGDHTQGS
jgi:hypothetical protein